MIHMDSFSQRIFGFFKFWLLGLSMERQKHLRKLKDLVFTEFQFLGELDGPPTSGEQETANNLLIFQCFQVKTGKPPGIGDLPQNKLNLSEAI